MLLGNFLSMKNATVDDMVGDEDLERANWEDGLVELGASDEEVGYLEEAIQLLGGEWGCSSSDEDGSSSFELLFMPRLSTMPGHRVGPINLLSFAMLTKQ